MHACIHKLKQENAYGLLFGEMDILQLQILLEHPPCIDGVVTIELRNSIQSLQHCNRVGSHCQDLNEFL